MSRSHFQAFTLKANGSLDKIITDVTVCAAYDPSAPPNPLPTSIAAKALWDTGASNSVISDRLAKSLGLVSVGKREVHHGDGSSQRETYMVNFGLPNNVGVVGLVATDFPASHDHFSVLIGMDVLRMGDFALTHVGSQTCMTFRMPSCIVIDYVVEANRLTYGGTPRNALCPCGSGKKFKFCHISAI